MSQNCKGINCKLMLINNGHHKLNQYFNVIQVFTSIQNVIKSVCLCWGLVF